MLGFARMQATRIEDLDINAITVELSGMASRLLEPSTLRLELGDVWPVRIDRAQLAQVFLNLVTNAREAGGNLTIQTARIVGGQGRRVRLSFSDDGRGMSPEVLARAFDPFYSTRNRGGAAGLGLATVYGIVSQHGGTVTARSEPLQGTCVTIELPAVEPHAALQEPERRAPRATASVMVVEDEPMVAELTRRILTHAGHRVQVAHDGEAALATIRQNPAVDVVVSDVVMPRLGGLELARILAVERPELPVLLVSGYAEDERRLHDEVLARTPFLPKPFKATELVGAVGALLERAGARVEATAG
jgi:CheY-like chemotaxis protein